MRLFKKILQKKFLIISRMHVCFLKLNHLKFFPTYPMAYIYKFWNQLVLFCSLHPVSVLALHFGQQGVAAAAVLRGTGCPVHCPRKYLLHPGPPDSRNRPIPDGRVRIRGLVCCPAPPWWWSTGLPHSHPSTALLTWWAPLMMSLAFLRQLWYRVPTLYLSLFLDPNHFQKKAACPALLFPHCFCSICTW